MFDVHGAVEPCDRPAVEGEAGEHILVAQRGEKLVLRDERLAVEDDTAAVVEVQLQQIVAHDAGGSDPFQSVSLFHIVLVKWVNLSQRLAVLHALPVLHQFILVLVKPFEDEVQSTARNLSCHPDRLNVDGGAILVVAHMEVRRVLA